MNPIAGNIAAARRKISALENQYRRSGPIVRLVAVSKRHSEAGIREAAAAGLEDFGENFLREAVDKIKALADLELNWHFIGPVQSNKTRGIAEHFDWVQSVDREKIAVRLNEQRPPDKAPLNVCVQVELSGQPGRSGVSMAQAGDLCELVHGLPRLRLRGLMAIPAPDPDFARQRQCFARLAREYERLRRRFPELDTLSMGMSDDFEAAIAEGSTMVRLGTALFGPRG